MKRRNSFAVQVDRANLLSVIKQYILQLALTAVLAGVTGAQAAAQVPASPALETRICLPLAAIRGSNVVNSRTIDFTLKDRSVWRANLRSACPQLGIERAFSYETGQSQLCAQDIIKVIAPMGGTLSGASCGLAPFQRQPARPR